MTAAAPIPRSTQRTMPRSNELGTKREIARLYVGRGSAQVLLVATAVLTTTRLAIGGFERGDAPVVLVTIAITGTVEWIIHKHLLHAPEDSWTSRTLDTGSGHRRHHLDPTDIEWLMLRGSDAGVFVIAFGAVTAAWSIPLMWIIGSPVFGPFVTAWACAAIGLGHYEWVHLMVHSSYRPRTPYYRRLARNHRRHHYRNEGYWLGVTANSGDRLLGTYPKLPTDVPISGTARDLSAARGEPS
jgi:Fatty acid hydroxylase